ncbi:MAG TPA: glycosyltransferase family 4 protein [Solirubrobacterales bacterium]|nr:glycosyltransferase family 4 protein [Solirubrobacterales bacterium]
MRTVYVVLPDGVDDPLRPSGGNTYDRHLCDELGAQGWAVRERAVAGFWGTPDTVSFAALEETLQQIPDDAVVLLDGLIASTAPAVLVPQASRLRLIVLVHMPLGHRPADDAAQQREREALAAASATVTTSAWARRRLLELYDLPAHRVRVAEPGVAPAGLVTGTEAGEALLCVGAVISEKGHDLLLEALESIAALSWSCTCVGRLDRDPDFVASLCRRSLDGAAGERVSFPGARTGPDLDRAYAAADLLVLASRAETYGMVVTEALSRGLPVVAAEVGGVGEALGEDASGARPGLLVAPEDPGALAGALSAWLGDAELRARLRRSAAQRRESLPLWSTTAAAVAEVLAEASA